MFPLNGCSAAASSPTAITRSTDSAPVSSTLARVVSKCVLGTTLLAPPTAVIRIFSAARPWWAGMTCSNGNSSYTAARNLNNDGEPA